MSNSRRSVLVISFLAAAIAAIFFLTRTTSRDSVRVDGATGATTPEERPRERTPLVAPDTTETRTAATIPAVAPSSAESPAKAVESTTPETPPAKPATALGRIFGRVLGPDGRPAVARAVSILRTPTGPTHTLTTDADGHFDAADFPAAKYHVSTRPEEAELAALGLRTYAGGVEWLAQTTVILAAGAEAEVNLGGPPEHPIRVHGRVLGDAPGDRTTLQWVPEGDDGYNRAHYTTSAEDGAYEIVLAEPGRYRLSAMLTSPAVRADAEVVVPDVSEFEWNVTAPDGRVAVRVEEHDHTAVKGARVDLVPRAGVAPIPFMSAAAYSRTTDAEGRVVFEAVRAGEWSIAVSGATISGDAPQAAAATTRAVVVHAGGRDEELVVEVAPGHVLSGVVRDEDGKPAVGTYVFVFDEHGTPLAPMQGERANKEGQFRLPAVAAGRFRAMGANGDHWTDAVEFEVDPRKPPRPIELTLRPAARLVVEFPTNAGPCWIDVRDEHENCVSGVLDRSLYSGAYGRGSSTRSAVYWLPRGNYEVRAVAADRVVNRTRVALVPGANANVRW